MFLAGAGAAQVLIAILWFVYWGRLRKRKIKHAKPVAAVAMA